MNNTILLIIAIISILPLPIWVVKRANRQRPYKAVLLLAFITTGALFYAVVSNYFSAQINPYLIAAVYYGAATCATTLVFLFFSHKSEGFTAQYQRLEQDRWQRFKTRPAKPARSRRDRRRDQDDDYKTGIYGGHGFGGVSFRSFAHQYDFYDDD